MIESIPEIIPLESPLNPNLRLAMVIGLTVLLTLVGRQGIPWLFKALMQPGLFHSIQDKSQSFSSSRTGGSLSSSSTISPQQVDPSSPRSSSQFWFNRAIARHQSLVVVTLGLLATELALLLLPRYDWYPFVEIPVSLGVLGVVGWLASELFKEFFDVYLLDAALKEGRKVNSELLILAKFSANSIIVIVAVILFAQTHQINVFGLIASLGIGGLAVAFAAQKTLEQLLGGIVIYVDRPFVVDDYIGLPDGTFGKVESIGLRSTKIRNSGKGTLMIVPNSALTQINIENFTGAKKVMSILYLNLHQTIPDEERALIRQVILESTKDIFGIDSRSTDVTFRPLPHDQNRTQVQVTFFILGSGDVSMDLRRQLLDIATQNINQQLRQYGVLFEIEEPTIYVDSPITI